LIDCFRTNVVGQIHLFNLFLPLVLKGVAKKVIALASGMADDALTVEYDLDIAGPYSISKAALNTTIAKYSAELRKDGVLFLSLSPGFVETGQYKNCKANLFASLRVILTIS
jgi:NAD(P)-dependent dehydrogenase (short-subunit alcohol dehydrogenase family)